MTRSERSIEAAFVRWCRSQGWLCLKLTYHERGWPDRAVLIPGGRLVLLEFKRPGGRRSPHQRLWLERLRALGFRAAFVESVEEAIQVVNLS